MSSQLNAALYIFFVVLGTRPWEIVGIQILAQDQILTSWLFVSRAQSRLSLHYISLTAKTATTTKKKLQQLKKGIFTVDSEVKITRKLR